MRVRFPAYGIAVQVPEGATLLEAARLAGVPLESPCDGSGLCGKCKVLVPEASTANLRLLLPDTPAEELGPGVILACHALVKGDVEVEILNGESGPLRILSWGRGRAFGFAPCIRKIYRQVKDVTTVYCDDALLATEPGDTTTQCFGAAVDIGTTTVVVALVDLQRGRELGISSSLNPQTIYGHDVLSRIRFSSEPEGLDRLHASIVQELNRSLEWLAQESGIELDRIYEVVLSGNTCMLHLAAGVNPSSLGRYPYTPALKGGMSLSVAEVGIALPGYSRVFFPPVISGFVGGDITAGVLATGLHLESGVFLFVDVGTNGEIVLSVDGRLTATSTAAGPAFEGMTITCGTRAREGAIETVDISEDSRVQVRTIGNAEPVGICGSGLVDAVAALIAHGVVDRNGRFAHPGHLPPLLRERLGARDGKPIFRLTANVHLTQSDIRQVQLAKGAIRAGIDILLGRRGLKYAEVDRVLIAGAFGFHLRTQSLIDIGILPPEVKGRVEFVGNTSMTGAQAFLLDRTTRDEMFNLVGEIEVVELANAPEFERTFIKGLAF